MRKILHLAVVVLILVCLGKNGNFFYDYIFTRYTLFVDIENKLVDVIGPWDINPAGMAAANQYNCALEKILATVPQNSSIGIVGDATPYLWNYHLLPRKSISSMVVLSADKPAGIRTGIL